MLLFYSSMYENKGKILLTLLTLCTGTSLRKQTGLHAENAGGGAMVVDTHPCSCVKLFESL